MIRLSLLFLAVCASTMANPLDERSEHTSEKFAPHFRRKLSDIMIQPAGSTVRLKCPAEGNPMPNVTWSKNNGDVIERPYFRPRYGRWSVLLEEVSRTDNANYTCLVCNELGCINNTFVLRVAERYPSRPYIKDGYPGNITAVVNETIKFSCPTTGDLEPYLYWVKVYDNFTITDDGLSLPAIGSEIMSDNPADGRETLTIAQVTPADQGWYGCVAMNTLGTTISRGYLTVLLSNSEQTCVKVCKCAD